jgi:dolichol kinase
VIYGMMREESRFENDVVSRAGAVGLMQLMPGTAREVARRIDLAPGAGDRLGDPVVNVSIGTWYAADLLEDGEGSVVWMLAAYNAGPGAARRWIEPGMGGDAAIDAVESIDYKETRGYVKRVVESANVTTRSISMASGWRPAPSDPRRRGRCLAHLNSLNTSTRAPSRGDNSQNNQDRAPPRCAGAARKSFHVGMIVVPIWVYFLPHTKALLGLILATFVTVAIDLLRLTDHRLRRFFLRLFRSVIRPQRKAPALPTHYMIAASSVVAFDHENYIAAAFLVLGAAGRSSANGSAHRHSGARVPVKSGLFGGVPLLATALAMAGAGGGQRRRWRKHAVAFDDNMRVPIFSGVAMQIAARFLQG